MMGQMSMRSALRKIKSSFFLSIEWHRLDQDHKTFKDFQQLKLKYIDRTLPKWLSKMEEDFGIDQTEQLTGRKAVIE